MRGLRVSARVAPRSRPLTRLLRRAARRRRAKRSALRRPRVSLFGRAQPDRYPGFRVLF